MPRFNKQTFNLGEQLSPSKRLEIYKRAVHIYHNNIPNLYGVTNVVDTANVLGLCLLLPCILFDSNNYNDDQPNGEYWDYDNTIESFIELKDFPIHPWQRESKGLPDMNNAIRESILRECIVKVKKLLKSK